MYTIKATDMARAMGIEVIEVKCEEEVCEYCNGEGVVTTDADDGEGHIMVGAGYEKKCICQLEN